MINDQIRLIRYAVIWGTVFVATTILSVIIPAALRQRTGILIAGVVATAAVVIEANTEEDRP